MSVPENPVPHTKMRLLLGTMSENDVLQLASERPLSAQANLRELRRVVRRSAKRPLVKAPRPGTATQPLPPDLALREKYLRASPTFAALYSDAQFSTVLVDLEALVPLQKHVFVRASGTFGPVPKVGDLDEVWTLCFPNRELPMPLMHNGNFVLRVPEGMAVPGPSSAERLPHGGFRINFEVRPRGEFVQVMHEGPNVFVIQGHHRLVALLAEGHRWVPALVRSGPWAYPASPLFFHRSMIAAKRTVRLRWFLDPSCYADIDCSELNDSIQFAPQLQRTVA